MVPPNYAIKKHRNELPRSDNLGLKTSKRGFLLPSLASQCVVIKKSGNKQQSPSFWEREKATFNLLVFLNLPNNSSFCTNLDSYFYICLCMTWRTGIKPEKHLIEKCCRGPYRKACSRLPSCAFYVCKCASFSPSPNTAALTGAKVRMGNKTKKDLCKCCKHCKGAPVPPFNEVLKFMHPVNYVTTYQLSQRLLSNLKRARRQIL